MKIHRLICDAWAICAPVIADGNGGYSCSLTEFLDSLPPGYERNAAGVAQLFEYVASNGPRQLPDSLSHRIDDKEQIWQFTKGGLRILWFYDAGAVVVCSHGFIKKTRTTPKSEKDRAIKFKKRYLEAKKTKQLVIIELDKGDD